MERDRYLHGQEAVDYGLADMVYASKRSAPAPPEKA